jgi:hypothetical protein
MKKIFTILLALSALSILVSGCKKAEEGTTEPGKEPAAGETKTEGEAK